MVKKGMRWAFGGLLIFMGLKNAFFPYPEVPIGIAQDLGYYGFSLTIILVGVWMIFRRGKEKIAPASENEISRPE